MQAAKPYQIDGINFLTSRTRAILADDPGLGKSMQLIKAANHLNQSDRILILCPAIGRVSWKIQLEEWDNHQRPPVFFPNKTNLSYALTGGLPKGPCAVIVTLEWLQSEANLKKLLKAVEASGPMDVAFVDEAHYLKNPKAQRTKSVYGDNLDLKGGAIQGTRVRWIATGTLTPIHAGEAYPHLRALFPDVLRNLFQGKIPNAFKFEEHFCHVCETRFGRQNKGNNAANIPALKAALEPHMILRRKADVLADLPSVLTIALPLETNFRSEKDDLTDEEVAAMSEQEVETALANLNAAASTKRRKLGQAKREAARAWIQEFLTSNPDKKLNVFGHHREVLEGLLLDHEKFNPVAVHGGTTPAQDQESVRRFQNDPDCRLFIGQNRAAGTSITLTAADTILLLEPDPAPQVNYQVISRSHRIGQRGIVTAVIAYDHGSALERRHVKVLRRRATDNENLFGGGTPGVL